jgi:phage shock protein C
MSAPKRLYRSLDNKIIAGVCGGLGRYFGLDANRIRIAWLIAALLFGTGLVIYVVLWIVLPLEFHP